MAELFIGIGCEELPARYIAVACSGLRENILLLLKDIAHGEVQTWATPRRIAIAISDVAECSPQQEQLVTGPPASRAFVNGEPTKAALGFARGRGVAPSDLEIVTTPRGDVVAVRVTSGGESTVSRIQRGIEQAVLNIDFGRSMRWGTGSISWARPLHRLFALYDGKEIECQLGDISAKAESIGHRLQPAPFSFASSSEWETSLRQRWVEPCRHTRLRRCQDQLNTLANDLGATIQDWDLLEEVADLVEWPVTVACNFPSELLTLPPRLLVEAMKLHQRVFPLYKDDKLMSTFLAVTNHPYATDPDVASIIAEGNKRVLTARFYDAQFFYAEDRKRSLTEHGAKLASMRWVRNGGTMEDKATRIAQLAREWAPLLGARPDHAERAARLCKNDLTTQMVYEFPKLQGHVGRLLAEFDGEDPLVALAIEEHYLPRFAGDEPAKTKEGSTLALVDRWDTLNRCFALGLQPKGSGDPLGLRRAANGFLSTLLSSQTSFDLKERCASEELFSFLMARFKAQAQESFGAELVNAVLASNVTDPIALQGRLTAMKDLTESDGFSDLRATFKRVMGLSKDHASTSYTEDALVHDSERALHAHFIQLQDQVVQDMQNQDYGSALEKLRSLKPSVDALFDSVMVMDKDETLRNNRLGLLRSIADQFRTIADFTMLSTDG